jgi:hypothetical protein
MVSTIGTGDTRPNGSVQMSRCEWTMSNLSLPKISASICRWRCGAISTIPSASSACRRGSGTNASSFASVEDVAAANNVTSCPAATSPSHSVAITRSVPPYFPGGTASYNGAT